MKSAPSPQFRRLCLGLALLAVTWAFPSPLRADYYPLQTVKTIADTLKPNVLIVLATPQSMQGLPGENPARYNEVGADCENGNRFCRLVGQNGRWEFSGMGQNGMYFGTPPASCTHTETYTQSQTRTATTTTTATETTTQTMSGQQTSTGSGSATATATATGTNSGTGTAMGTGTGNVSGTVTASWTVTATTTPSATATRTAYATVTVTTTAVGTAILTQSATSSSGGAVTLTATGTATGTVTQTGQVTASQSATATATATGSVTATGTAARTAAVTATGTVTVSTTTTVTGTPTTTRTLTIYATGTVAGSTTLTATGTVTATTTVTANQTATATLAATGTKTLTGTVSATATVTGTATVTATGAQVGNGTKSATATASLSATANSTGMGTGNAIGAYYTVTGNITATNTWNIYYIASKGSNRTITGTGTGTETAGSYGDMGGTGSRTISATGTATIAVGTSAINITQIVTTTCAGTGVLPATGTAMIPANASNGSGTHTATGTCWGGVNSNGSYSTGTGTASATLTGTAIVTGTGTVCVTATVSATGSGTATASATKSGASTASTTGVATGSVTATGTATVTVTGTVTASPTATGSATFSNTVPGTQYSTAVMTESYAATDTHVVSTCGVTGATDPSPCTGSPDPTSGYCAVSMASCTSESQCATPNGDYCRRISSLDGSGRLRGDYCVGTSATWSSGSCKHGVRTANTPCSSWSDTTTCKSPLGDYCAEGAPAMMCADSGLWCRDNNDCPGGAGTDLCVGATSRMMTVKRALRRAVTEYSDKVSFGFMNSYQGRGIPATATDASTAIFPYVKLTSCTATDVTETKLLTRGELEAAGCFTLTGGPTSPCTIDYGGNGAINPSAAAVNRITYTLAGGNDSHWGVPRGDGSGKVGHVDASWASCSSQSTLPACSFSGTGTGLYEGSFYTFTFKQGTPVASGDGSVAQPHYFTTYLGKYYNDGATCWNAIEAERSEIVNDGVYGRPPYVLAGTATSPYTVTVTGTSTTTSVAIDTGKETSVSVPWVGASGGAACNSTSGAVWNSAAVPFLNQTKSSTSTSTSTATFTFNGKGISTGDRALMIAGRLEKASFGGVYATGSVSPVYCSLSDANTYLSSVQSNDALNNGGNAPCWSNNIVLVVDGQPTGFNDSDADGTINCASTACAYDAVTNPNLTGCNCQAINKAFTLASSGIQTHVVVNAPNSAKDTLSWNARYPYTYAFLWNLAVAGSPNHDGVASFGTTEDEVYHAISDKIAAAAYHFTYTTAGAVAGVTTQDPNTQVLSNSTMLYDTSISYPSFKGTIRAFDTTSSVVLTWDAATVAADTHPGWKNRRIYFSDKSGNIIKVNIDAGSGAVTNGTTLLAAGLGATDAEAARIMQWLLGTTSLGNATPLMGSLSSSTPIVVGQAAANGLNGSAPYSQNTWKRPPLVYVGADDGMLHAFFAHAGTKVLDGVSYAGGEEAFAFIPNDMLPVITKLYAQGGQKLPFDKGDHIFGLASSPKVKDMCQGATCSASDGDDWHTVLVMPEGPGGNKAFALDITNVIDATDGLHPENMRLLWSTAIKTAGTTDAVKLPSATDGQKWDQSMGETTSVPSFYFAGYVAGAADNRVLFASGYPVHGRAGAYAYQGLSLLNADTLTGAVKETLAVPDAQTTCAHNRAVMADIAVARDYASASTSQNLLAAYFADTWGNAFQYIPGHAITTLYRTGNTGCDQPIFFTPAVVQLDRAPKADTSSKHAIYLVQVTGTAMDSVTTPVTATYPASQMVVTKLDGNVSPPLIVTSYNKNAGSGQIVLSAATTTPAANRICIQSDNGTAFTGTMKTSSQTCADVGGIPLPESARPVGTPTVALRGDGLGFQAITAWYDPTAMANNCSSGAFNYGKSYVTVHEFGADGTWFQIAGVTLDNTALTGIAFIGTGLFVDGLINSATPTSINIGETFSTMQQVLNNNNGLERYLRSSWTERVDL